MRIAILGGGVMGETLAARLLEALDPRPEIVIVEKRSERAAQLIAQHAVAVADPETALAGADVVVLAVKPQDVPTVLAEAGRQVPATALVISIAAGIPTAVIEREVPPGVSVVRAMPNTPARIGRGVTGISPGSNCPPESLALAARLLATVGVVVEVPEAMQDVVTAVSGSGPAYVFLLAEAMTAAAVEAGLDPDTADQLVRGTVLGAAALLDSSPDSPAQLRHDVTSPNGTTAAAIAAMEQRGVSDAIAHAVHAARERSRELSAG